MREDDRRRAVDFVKDLYAAGDIDASRFDTGMTGLLAAGTEAELAGVVRSMPAPVALTSPAGGWTSPWNSAPVGGGCAWEAAGNWPGKPT